MVRIGYYRILLNIKNKAGRASEMRFKATNPIISSVNKRHYGNLLNMLNNAEQGVSISKLLVLQIPIVLYPYIMSR